MPITEAGTGPVCVEETEAESRSARLALRKAALRRHVMRADTALRLKKDYRKPRELATLIKVSSLVSNMCHALHFSFITLG